MEINETNRFIPKGFELGTTLIVPNRFMAPYSLLLYLLSELQKMISKARWQEIRGVNL